MWLTWRDRCTGLHRPSTRFRGSGHLGSKRESAKFESCDCRTHVGSIVVPSLVNGVTRVALDTLPPTVGVEEPVLDGGSGSLDSLRQEVQGSSFDRGRSGLGTQGGDGDGRDDGRGSHCEDES